MIKNIPEKLTVLLLAVSLSIVLVGLYWSFRPYRLFTYTTSPMKILTPNVKIGGNLIYVADYCKYTNKIPTSVKRQLVGNYTYYTPGSRASGTIVSYAYDLPISTSSNFPKGCGKIEVDTPLLVPDSIKLGAGRVCVVNEYQANPLRIVDYEMCTEEFNIIK